MVATSLRAVSLLLENLRGKRSQARVTHEQQPRVARTVGDEREERLQWFHTTIVKPGTLVTE